MAINEKQRKAVLLASVLAILSSTSIMSGGFRHLVKLGPELVFGIQARTLAYCLLVLSIIGMASGIAMLVKLVYDSRQSD